MIGKRYYSRTDLKVAGFYNLSFYGNMAIGNVYLSADIDVVFNEQKHKLNLTVECEIQNTSQRSIANLCKLMFDKLNDYKTMKTTEQKKFVKEYGEKLEI
jgi:hypothetical protein